MQTKAEKNLANLLLKSEKRVSQLEQHLNLEKENVKIEVILTFYFHQFFLVK